MLKTAFSDFFGGNHNLLINRGQKAVLIIKASTGQKLKNINVFFYVSERSLLCSSRLHYLI